MDALAELALTALDTTVAGLLSGPVPAGLGRQVRIVPSVIRAAGLGGYVGKHPDPRGGIFARRVDAFLDLEVTGGNAGAAGDYLALLVRSLLAQDRGELRRGGIYQLRLNPEVREARLARFDLCFEYRHLPSAGEGVIDTLDLGLDLNLTPYRARHRWDLASRSLVGAAQPLADFQVADDPNLNAASPASAWAFNASEGRIEQNAAARGGPLTLAQPRKAGAQLLWRPGGEPIKPARIIAAIDFASASPDGIGLVFGRRDEQNFWYFLASQRNRYHVFGRKRAGAWSFVGAPAEDVGFSLNGRHVLRVTAHDHNLVAELDGARTLQVETEALVEAGEIGFLTHGNNQGRFFRARLIELI